MLCQMQNIDKNENAIRSGIIEHIRSNGCLLPSDYYAVARTLKTSREQIEYQLSTLVQKSAVKYGEVAHLPSQIRILTNMKSALHRVGSVDKLKPIKEALESICKCKIDYVQLRAAVQHWHEFVVCIDDQRRLIKRIEMVVAGSKNRSLASLRAWRRLCNLVHQCDLLHAIEGGLLCGDLRLEWLAGSISRHDMAPSSLEWKLVKPDEVAEDALIFRHWVPADELEALLQSYRFTDQQRRQHAHVYRDFDMDHVQLSLLLEAVDALDDPEIEKDDA